MGVSVDHYLIVCCMYCSCFYPGDKAWQLYSVYGLPVDVMQLMAEERNLTIDMEAYEKARQCYQVSSETDTSLVCHPNSSTPCLSSNSNMYMACVISFIPLIP